MTEEQRRDGRPGSLGWAWRGLEGPGECSGQFPGGQGCMAFAVAPARVWYPGPRGGGQAARAWVPEPWPCSAGPGTVPWPLYVVFVMKSIVCGNSLPGFGPGSSFTSQVSPGQGHNSPKRREPAKRWWPQPPMKSGQPEGANTWKVLRTALGAG